MYSKSQKTGLSEGSASARSSNAGDDSAADDAEEDAEKSMATDAAQNDPVLIAFATLFDNIKEGIVTNAE